MYNLGDENKNQRKELRYASDGIVSLPHLAVYAAILVILSAIAIFCYTIIR